MPRGYALRLGGAPALVKAGNSGVSSRGLDLVDVMVPGEVASEDGFGGDVLLVLTPVEARHLAGALQRAALCCTDADA